MRTAEDVLAYLDQYRLQGWLRPLDRAFVSFLHKQAPDANELVLLAAALVSHQLGAGEVYLDLEALVKNPVHTLGLSQDQAGCLEAGQHNAFTHYTLNDWLQGLQQSPELVALAAGTTPLVLDLEHNRLFLRRYWAYQQTVNTVLTRLVKPIRTHLPEELVSDIIHLFQADPALSDSEPDWQKIACVLALRARFSMITGGPGTGKTTTLTRLLALLIKLASVDSSREKPLNIVLAAPTGKAAARVSDSIAKAVAKLRLDDAVRLQIPRTASTLHRLLGSRPHTRQYQYNRHHHLVADVVIVDEASMIDLEMMAALLEALPETASLILLGDKEQLASVEPGSVLGDLCQGAGADAYDPATLNWIKQYAQIQLSESAQSGNHHAYHQQTAVLVHSHRFDAKSGIGSLARAVNSGEYSAVATILRASSQQYPDLNPEHLPVTFSSEDALNRLKLLVLPDTNVRLRGYRLYREVIKKRSSYASTDDWALAVHSAFDTFRVLSPLRKGIWGVEGLNQQIEAWLGVQQVSGHWYEGRPVMVTQNDYGLGLMNGDIGIALHDENNKLRIAFLAGEKQIHWVSPLRLPFLETAYAMTVHKSQGSEFDHVVLTLPDQYSQVLTREMIYTGITRAARDFTLLEPEQGVLCQAVAASCR